MNSKEGEGRAGGAARSGLFTRAVLGRRPGSVVSAPAGGADSCFQLSPSPVSSGDGPCRVCAAFSFLVGKEAA